MTAAPSICEARDPRTHQRRYASKTIRGSQRDAARALMGHSSTRTTMDVYYQVSDEEKWNAMDRTAGGLGSAPPAVG